MSKRSSNSSNPGQQSLSPVQETDSEQTSNETESDEVIDPDYPVLTEENLKNRNYECISGKYFKNGKWVPLSNRPTETTQERVLKNHPTVEDVIICGFSTFVHVTDLSELDSISEILQDEVGDRYTGKVENNTRYMDAEFMLDFRPKGY